MKIFKFVNYPFFQYIDPTMYGICNILGKTSKVFIGTGHAEYFNKLEILQNCPITYIYRSLSIF